MNNIPKDWCVYKLKDLSIIGDGAHASIKRIEKGVLYLTSKNFGKDRLDLSKVDYISKEDFARYFKNKSKALTKPEQGDVLIGIIGTIGSPYLVGNGDEFGLSSSVSIIRADTAKLQPEYLYYWFKTPLFQSALNQIKSGVAQSFLSLAMIGSLPCVYPLQIKTQQKIAQILSAYDDLIENNLKRIKLLEEMAQITYEQWFVRMKFPNHKTTPIDAETGLPEGWEKRDILELCQKITDGTHDSPKQVEQGIPLITGKHILNGFINFNSAYLISEEDHKKIKKRSGLEKGDILFSNIGTLGNIGVVVQEFEYSCKNVIIFKRKQGFDNFLYTYLSSQHTKEKLDSQSSGVAQKFYSLKFIRGLNEILPADKLINDFDDIVSPIYKLKYQLNKQNQHLKEARDILLPRLMTGMIDVDKIKLPQPLDKNSQTAPPHNKEAIPSE